MATVRIHWHFDGLDAVKAAYDRASSGGKAVMAEHGNAIARDAQDIYRMAAPKRTGRFAAGLSARSESAGDGFKIEVTTDNPQLRGWIKEGTGEKRPRTAKALYGEGFAHPVAKTGPTKPNDWEQSAESRTRDRVGQEGKAILDEITAMLEG